MTRPELGENCVGAGVLHSGQNIGYHYSLQYDFLGTWKQTPLMIPTQ